MKTFLGQPDAYILNYILRGRRVTFVFPDGHEEIFNFSGDITSETLEEAGLKNPASTPGGTPTWVAGKEPASVIIGTNVTGVGLYTFAGCSELTSVTILDGVTSIGDAAFGVCTKLENVKIGNSVESIGM